MLKVKDSSIVLVALDPACKRPKPGKAIYLSKDQVGKRHEDNRAIHHARVSGFVGYVGRQWWWAH
jgi:hypothetical protein